MTVIPDGYGQITFVHEGGGVDGEACVTMGFRNEAGQSASFIANNLGPVWSPVVEGCMVEGITWTSARVKLGPVSTGPYAEGAYAVVGDQGTDQTPPGTSILVGKVTALGGRRGRGRMYLPGPTDAALLATGQWDGANIAQWQGLMDDFLGDMSTLDWIPVVLHDSATTPTPITELTVRSRSGTQRRRNRR